MKLLIDLIGVCGFAALSAGLYLQYGPAFALQVCGGLLLMFALIAARGSKK